MASKRRNVSRGRECLLWRDLKDEPVTYSIKVRSKTELEGLISSNDELFDVISKALAIYRTEDLSVALRRIGKGICPKSFPTSRESHYFLELYYRTHGGEYGMDLKFLPLPGALLEQPNIFFYACDIIGRVRRRYFDAKMKEDESKVHNQVSQQANS